MSRPGTLDEQAERRFWKGVQSAGKFFMKTGDVHQALTKLARTLDALDIPYAIIGAMALNEFGYQRTTVDVDVLLTAEGLAAFKAQMVGRGYVEKFEGSRGLRDTEHGVGIDVVIAGTYPGDGQPKPVAFPDPAVAAQRGMGIALLPLEILIELKIASGLTAPHRLKDLADVQELIRIQRLPRTLAGDLNAFVQAKYLELWQGAQVDPDE